MANVPPIVDLNGAGGGNDTNLGYAENAPLTLIAPNATASDSDSPDLDQGSLTVAFTAGGTTDDQLRVAGGGDFMVDETDLYYQGVPIGSITGGTDGSTPLMVTFNADATPAIAQALIRAIGYVNFSATPVPGDRTVTFTLADGDGGASTPRVAVITVTAVDTPPVGQNDAVATDENAVATGSLFADNGNGEDIDPDGPPLTISAVAGSPANVGTTITLASGAKLNVNSDGSYSYDPNGKFTRLTDAESGAVNTSTVGDTFTYTLAGGNTVTVTVTVNGVAGPGDWLMGDSTDNVITGTANGDFFFDTAGGDDYFTGLGGSDVFLVGAALTAADVVDGGEGRDQLAIQGNYALTLGSGIVGLESIAILPGSDTRFGDPGTNSYDYNLTTLDVNVAAGVQMIVDASGLRVGEDFTFNGSAETNGSFFIYGGRGVDTLTGGAGNDAFYFGEGLQFGAGDVVNGGPGGIDQLGLRGSYTVVFGANQLIGIENIGLVSAQDTRFGPLGASYNYNLTMNDGNVIAGAQLTLDAFALRAGETLSFNGAAETNGSFRIFGGQGNDAIVTGSGNDILAGNRGADNLTSGGGADTFRYNATADSAPGAADHIHDFASMMDKIDLIRIDANTHTAGDQAFHWIGATAFTGSGAGSAGELRAFIENNDHFVIEGDTDGNGVADLRITMNITQFPLGESDFLL